MNNPMISLQVEQIRHRFDRGPEVIQNVSFDLKAGEFLCLLGPSGCGKTTLLRLAAGLEKVQQGRVIIAGEIVADGSGLHVAPEMRRVGMMFQDFALFPHLTITQNIFFGVQKNSSDQHRWIEETAWRMGIGELMNAYPHRLSSGQQQRVALVRALAPSPRVLLLDEPFSGLDVTRRMLVREQTQTLLQENGIATLMVTHDPEEAMFMADRILVMHNGRIVQDGTPSETFFHPANAYVADLFGPVNRLQGHVIAGKVNTLLGSFSAGDIPEGTRVEILIRPEAILLNPAAENKGTKARVLNSRLLGNTSQIRLAPEKVDPHVEPLLAHIQGIFLPAQNTVVSLTLEEKNTFIFPA